MKWSGRVDLNHRPPGPEPASKKSLATNRHFAFSVFSLIWGMCSSLDTNPNRSKNIGFWHTFGTGSPPAPLLPSPNTAKAGAPPRFFGVDSAQFRLSGTVGRLLRSRLRFSCCCSRLRRFPQELSPPEGASADVMKPIAAPITDGRITSTIHVLKLVPVFLLS
jgi:hypothetical protein